MLGVLSTATIRDDENWIPARYKVNKKKSSSYNTAWKVELSTISSNRFSPLDNLRVNGENEVITVNNSENIFTSIALKNAICHQTGSNKIPTLINGLVKNSDIQNPSKTKSIPPCAKPDKSIKCHHKAHIIGESHLKVSATKINKYLNTNFVVSSFIKPGANIKQTVHSQETEFKCLGKDIIVVNGGTNDVDNNTEKRKSDLVHMLQFAQKYMNTNIIMVNIPLKHDLAMNSQINLEIQDLNNKVSRTAKLFSHADLVEMNFNRKYFTKYGLH
jgi:hypothetical protein